MSTTEIGWCSIGEAMTKGLEELLHDHWIEVEAHRDEIPLAVDWPRYNLLERTGIYKSVAAQKDGRLVGYASYFLQPSLHNRYTVFAVNDVLYVARQHRKGLLGPRLIREAEKLLAAEGARVITQGDRKSVHSTDENSRANLGHLLLRSGYELAEKVYAKLL